MTTIQTLNLYISKDSIEDGLICILRTIRPLWKELDIIFTMQSIHFQRLQGGLFNDIWKCINAKDPDDIILVRIFSDLLQKSVDVVKKVTLLESLSNSGVCMPIYARFDNGLAYKYQPGSTLTPEQAMDPKIYSKLIDQFHKLHLVPLGPAAETIAVFNKIGLQAINSDGYANASKDKRFFEAFGNQLKEDISIAVQLYKETTDKFPFKLSHCDANLNNIIYDSNAGDVTLIDWDVLGIFPEPFVIAVIFARDQRGLVKSHGFDFAFDEKFKTDWLRQYMITHPEINEVTDDLFSKWMNAVNKGIYYTAITDVVFAMSNIINNPPEKWEVYLSHASLHYSVAKRMKLVLRL